VIERFGGASRDRTDDLIVANDALSQLSYSPVRLAGFTFFDFNSGSLISPRQDQAQPVASTGLNRLTPNIIKISGTWTNDHAK
jgi:hypothetical protein